MNVTAAAPQPMTSSPAPQARASDRPREGDSGQLEFQDRVELHGSPGVPATNVGMASRIGNLATRAVGALTGSIGTVGAWLHGDGESRPTSSLRGRSFLQEAAWGIARREMDAAACGWSSRAAAAPPAAAPAPPAERREAEPLGACYRQKAAWSLARAAMREADCR